MAMRHGGEAVEGVQLHTEAVLTEGGHLLLANWLADCGDTDAPKRAPALAEQLDRQRGPDGYPFAAAWVGATPRVFRPARSGAGGPAWAWGAAHPSAAARSSRTSRTN